MSHRTNNHCGGSVGCAGTEGSAGSLVIRCTEAHPLRSSNNGIYFITVKGPRGTQRPPRPTMSSSDVAALRQAALWRNHTFACLHGGRSYPFLQLQDVGPKVKILRLHLYLYRYLV